MATYRTHWDAIKAGDPNALRHQNFTFPMPMPAPGTYDDLENYFLCLELGGIEGSTIDWDPIFDPPKLEKIEREIIEEYGKQQLVKQAATSRAAELAARIVSEQPSLAKRIIEQQGESP